jgi:hypothetical protein
MLNDSRKSLHYCLFSGSAPIVVGSSEEIFHLVNSEMVGGQFAEMGISFYYSGSHTVTIECRVRNTGSSTLLATTTVSNWVFYKKVTTASAPTYKLAAGDKVYFAISAIGSDYSTPVVGCSTYVTFK